MIRLATVFSGIGAIEHALDRMNIRNEIVFACDNGDVTILDKDVGMNIYTIGIELNNLDSMIKEISFGDEFENLYKQQLVSMLKEAQKEFDNIQSELETIDEIDDNLIIELLNRIISMEGVKKSRVEEYKTFLSSFGEGTYIEHRFRALQVIWEIINDYKKDNSLDKLGDGCDFYSKDNINWKEVSDALKELYVYLEKVNGRKVIRKVKDISQRTSQLYEKINYMKEQKHLEDLGNDWAARKAYVDSLYKGLEEKNKVKKSYLANYVIDPKDYHWNVAFLDGGQYRGQVDLFVGGSPCQSFSLVGKQRGLDDTRGTLFYEFARLISEIRPKVFIYENVRAVKSHDDGKTWNKMQEVFGELGYKYYSDVLNARDYGIPQNRERLFVVGFREDLSLANQFRFPEKEALNRTMSDFLDDNASGRFFLPQKGVEFVTRDSNIEKRFTQINGQVQLCQKKNQQFNWHGDFVFQSEEDAVTNNIADLESYMLSAKAVKYVLPSGSEYFSANATSNSIPDGLREKLLNEETEQYTVTEGRIRKLTPNECLRLMGFEDFQIVVDDTSMYKQAGNSIVVDVLIRIVEEVLRAYPQLDDER